MPFIKQSNNLLDLSQEMIETVRAGVSMEELEFSPDICSPVEVFSHNDVFDCAVEFCEQGFVKQELNKPNDPKIKDLNRPDSGPDAASKADKQKLADATHVRIGSDEIVPLLGDEDSDLFLTECLIQEHLLEDQAQQSIPTTCTSHNEDFVMEEQELFTPTSTEEPDYSKLFTSTTPVYNNATTSLAQPSHAALFAPFRPSFITTLPCIQTPFLVPNSIPSGFPTSLSATPSSIGLPAEKNLFKPESAPQCKIEPTSSTSTPAATSSKPAKLPKDEGLLFEIRPVGAAKIQKFVPVDTCFERLFGSNSYYIRIKSLREPMIKKDWSVDLIMVQDQHETKTDGLQQKSLNKKDSSWVEDASRECIFKLQTNSNYNSHAYQGASFFFEISNDRTGSHHRSSTFKLIARKENKMDDYWIRTFEPEKAAKRKQSERSSADEDMTEDEEDVKLEPPRKQQRTQSLPSLLGFVDALASIPDNNSKK